MKHNFSKKLQKCRDWQTHVGRELIRRSEWKSVVDYGCGNGYLISGAREAGAFVMGYDGNTTQSQPYWPENVSTSILQTDFTEFIPSNYRYDLVVSLEVAEHIEAQYANKFIDMLTLSGNCIFFSAAIPNQGGDGHANEQPKEYWIEKFSARNYIYNSEVLSIIKNIYETMPYSSKYISVMKRNIMYFCRNEVE